MLFYVILEHEKKKEKNWRMRRCVSESSEKIEHCRESEILPYENLPLTLDFVEFRVWINGLGFIHVKLKWKMVKCRGVKCNTPTLYNFTALLEKFLLLNKVARISPAKKLLHTESGAHWSLLLPLLRDKVTCRFNRAIGYQPVDTRWYSRYSFIRTILQTYIADSTDQSYAARVLASMTLALTEFPECW